MSKMKRQRKDNSWDPIADWYHGWVGKDGSYYHRQFAFPTVIELLELQPQHKILDVGCGNGALAPHILKHQASYFGIDISNRMIMYAKEHFGNSASFLQADVRDLHNHEIIKANKYDSIIFLLSIQDMNPLEEVIFSVSDLLKTEGKIVFFMLHPCFRIPRQSGWGWHENIKLRYRKVNRYLTKLNIPLKNYHEKGVARKTISYHRPLQDYINILGRRGIYCDTLREISGYDPEKAYAHSRGENISEREIPLFLALRGIRLNR